MLRRLVTAAAVLAGLHALPAQALEFRSVKETGVALYEAPALSAKKLFLVSRYYPVEVLSSQKDWARVRDATGGIAWIPQAALSGQRWLLVTADQAVVRATASADGQPLFSVARDGVLQWQEAPKDGWVKVKHRDGSSGFARITDLWGL
ncbi:SH3 domain-containing protein [Aquitalea sp. ASV15]|uniref:SH3 domain-containing protein n=1 Tax=Aquitalea sp. ASV15 TaxID=2795104 RepID=UPI0018EE2E3E|nr:SH3 domain-containing protein [Aquitalea sp. ASV15]